MKKIIITLILVVMCNCMVHSKEPSAGYRGFIEWDNSFGPVDYRHSENILDWIIYTGISTSHGYQFNNNLYLGAGLDVSIGNPGSMVPVFADFRYDRAFGKFTPFGDIRIGYNLAGNRGLYLSPTIGYRFNWGRKAAFNIGLGVTLLGDQEHDCVYNIFSARLGFDF